MHDANCGLSSMVEDSSARRASGVHTSRDPRRRCVICGRYPPSASHSSRSVGGGGSSSSESDSGLFSLPFPFLPLPPLPLRGSSRPCLSWDFYLSCSSWVPCWSPSWRLLLLGRHAFLRRRYVGRSRVEAAAGEAGAAPSGSRCCFAGQRSSPAVVGRRLVAPRPARTRCTEGLASALDGAARYLTLHTSIVPCGRRTDHQPRVARRPGVSGPLCMRVGDRRS